MANLPLTYWLELPSGRYPLRVVRGEEGLSRTFRFELTFPVDAQDGLDPEATIRSEATIVMQRDTEVRRVVGVVSRIARRATRKGEPGSGEITLTVEPRLALLRKRQDIRVFRNKTVPEIVREVVALLGISLDRRLRGNYKKRPYCVQFRESDYDFVARLLEDEGIYYNLDDADQLVIGDSPQAYDDSYGVVEFKHGSGLDQNEDAITEVGFRGAMTAGKVSLRDFNHVAPKRNMDVSAEGPTVGGAEWYDYPGEYEEPGEGAAKAALRAEALRCEHTRLFGKSFAPLRPGITFALASAPDGVESRDYVVTRVRHDWQLAKGGFQIEFEGLPADLTYRPPVVTKAPVEPNPLTGYVTGPAGADIHTDEWGQVKVHFPWDRLQPKDDDCSHWVPVLQDNTGHSSSMSRTGWEVLCQFMEGDPDRPIVMGRVYNPKDPFYNPLPDRKMRMALRSLTSPRVDGNDTPSNLIQFDDWAGAEGILVNANRDQNVVVDNNKEEQVDSTESLTVNGNETIRIGTDQKLQIKGSYLPDVLGNQSRSIGGNHSVDIAQGETETIDQNHSMTIAGSHKRIMGTADTTYVAGNLKETVGAVILETSAKTNTYIGEKTNTLVVGGAVIEVAKGNKMDGAGLGKVAAVGGLTFSKAGKVMATRAEELRSTLVGGIFSATSIKSMLVAGLQKLTKKALSASYEGASEIVLKVKETELIMKGGLIDFHAAKSITIETSQKNAQSSKSATQI